MNINDIVNEFGEALEPKNIKLAKSQKTAQELFENTFILPELLKTEAIPVTSKFVQAINMLICDLQKFSYNNMFVTLTSDKLIDFFEYIQFAPDYVFMQSIIDYFIHEKIDENVDLFFIEPTTPDARFRYNPTYFNPKYIDLVYETNRVIDREFRCKSINLNNFTIHVDGELVYKYGENYEHR